MENLHIVDSYKISKWNMLKILKNRDCVLERSNFSLLLEWASHNLLYDLHIARERTKDVDLEYPQKWYYKVAYFIIGLLALIVIK